MTQQYGFIKISVLVLSLLVSNGVLAGGNDDDDEGGGNHSAQVLEPITDQDRVNYWPPLLPRQVLNQEQQGAWEQSCKRRWNQWWIDAHDYARAHAWAPRVQRSNPQGCCATLQKVVMAPLEIGGFIYDSTVWDDFLNERPIEEGIDMAPYQAYLEQFQNEHISTVIVPKAFKEFLHLNRISLPPERVQPQNDVFEDEVLIPLIILLGVSFSIIPH